MDNKGEGGINYLSQLVRENERLRTRVRELMVKIRAHGQEGMSALEEIDVLLGKENNISETPEPNPK